MSVKRCAWVTDDPLYIDYHDEEWGVPIYDDRLLFEFLILEGMQAGLSWFTILKKREHMRAVFDKFDPKKIAEYKKEKIMALLQDAGIIRNERKILSAIQNAKAFLEIHRKKNDFSNYLWQFVAGKPIQNNWMVGQIPSHTEHSDKMAKDLKKRNFNFVGTTICYAFMQAAGMVNDHETSCFRHRELKKRG